MASQMATERVGDMTREELRAFIRETMRDQGRETRTLGDNTNLKELLDSIDEHLWTPPPGTPSTLELLREDRDS